MKTIKTVKSKSAKTTTKPAERASATKTSATARPVRATKPASAAAASNGDSMNALRREITTDLIAIRAYIIWEKQGRPQGNDVANWLLAESQLKEEIQQSFTA